MTLYEKLGTTLTMDVSLKNLLQAHSPRVVEVLAWEDDIINVGWMCIRD
jgi:hypothetical protein